MKNIYKKYFATMKEFSGFSDLDYLSKIQPVIPCNVLQFISKCFSVLLYQVPMNLRKNPTFFERILKDLLLLEHALFMKQLENKKAQIKFSNLLFLIGESKNNVYRHFSIVNM